MRWCTDQEALPSRYRAAVCRDENLPSSSSQAYLGCQCLSLLLPPAHQARKANGEAPTLATAFITLVQGRQTAWSPIPGPLSIVTSRLPSTLPTLSHPGKLVRKLGRPRLARSFEGILHSLFAGTPGGLQRPSRGSHAWSRHDFRAVAALRVAYDTRDDAASSRV